jgi:hypothetical protein
MDQAKSGLRLPVLGAVDRTASYATMARDGVESSQDLQQLLGGITQVIPGLIQALPAIIGAFL